MTWFPLDFNGEVLTSVFDAKAGIALNDNFVETGFRMTTKPVILA